MTRPLTHLDRLLSPGGMKTLFQPIFDLSGERPLLRGAECLTRGIPGSNLEAADILFSYAREKRAEVSVDRAAITVALRASGELGLDLELHLNVHASTLGLDPSIPDYLAQEADRHGLDPGRLTVEIVEQAEHLDRDTFTRSVARLREAGFTIALDDVGLGRSNYLMIYLTQPEVLKADRFFVHGIARDPLRHAVFVSIVRVAEELGARIVAEGVEQDEDLAVLRDLGVREFQGFLLSPPLVAEGLRKAVGDHTWKIARRA